MYKKKKNIKKICHTLYKIYLYCLKCIKGVYTGSYEQFGEKMYTMWFGMYERSSGHLSSSGFEHVFIGKLQGVKKKICLSSDIAWDISKCNSAQIKKKIKKKLNWKNNVFYAMVVEGNSDILYTKTLLLTGIMSIKKCLIIAELHNFLK